MLKTDTQIFIYLFVCVCSDQYPLLQPLSPMTVRARHEITLSYVRSYDRCDIWGDIE